MEIDSEKSHDPITVRWSEKPTYSVFLCFYSVSSVFTLFLFVYIQLKQNESFEIRKEMYRGQQYSKGETFLITS